jgi:hypothetical protein
MERASEDLQEVQDTVCVALSQMPGASLVHPGFPCQVKSRERDATGPPALRPRLDSVTVTNDPVTAEAPTSSTEEGA